MHPSRPGARFLGRLLRSLREAQGLARGEVVRRSAGGAGPGLTPTILRDLETGDRLPTLGRLPALARALGVTAGELLAWVELAPVLEGAGRYVGAADRALRGDARLRRAGELATAGRPAVAAVLACEAWWEAGPGVPPPAVLVRAVLELGQPFLALLLAGRSPSGSGILAVELEALRRLGLARVARRACPPVAVPGADPSLLEVQARLLEETDPAGAMERWSRLLERARRNGDRAAASRASAGVARCLAAGGSRGGPGHVGDEPRRRKRRRAGRLAPPRPGD